MAARQHCEPVFFLTRDLSTIDDKDRPCDALEICLAAESVCGRENIIGAQEIRGLWRVYPATRPARTDLLVNGMSIRGRAITIFDKNPFILRGGNETPTTKIWIGDIPLSVANEDIESALVRIGCVMRSSLMNEKIRNRDGRLTRFLTGRRFAFISVPENPLERTLSVGTFRATVYHKEQPKRRKSATICSKCLQLGHWATECDNEVTCRECKKPGHKRGDPECTAISDQGVHSIWGPRSIPARPQREADAAKTVSIPPVAESAKDTASEDDDVEWEDSMTEGEAPSQKSDAGKKRKSKDKKSPTERGRHLKRSASRQATLAFQARPRTHTPKRARSRIGDSPNDSTPEKSRKLTTATDTESARAPSSPNRGSV